MPKLFFYKIPYVSKAAYVVALPHMRKRGLDIGGIDWSKQRPVHPNVGCVLLNASDVAVALGYF